LDKGNIMTTLTEFLSTADAVTKSFDVESTAKPNAPTQLMFSVACADGSGCEITEITQGQ